VGVGQPQGILLNQFGDYLYAAFGEMPYHVGSSLEKKDGWRDVDVRLMLPDEEWARLQLGNPDNPHSNKRWVALTLAWSAFGRQITGLPIDFQIQQRKHANATYLHKPGLHYRSALFTVYETEASR
jgi:hypothetical protein